MRITRLATASLPMGTVSCGRFAIRRSKSFCSSSAAVARVVRSAICSPICRTRCSSSPVSSPRDFLPPISLLNFFRSAFNCCTAVSAFRRSTSTRNTSSILASSPPPRVARRSRTKSGFSRIRRISSMAQIISEVKNVTNVTSLKAGNSFNLVTALYSPLVEKLDLLAVALGLAALAGINLYLTVFATGLAIHFQWFTLAPQYQSLEILGNPWIITIAGILYLLEFFADKIPWLDSAWDAVHTVIRPIGGALLAIQVLGHPSPAFTVIVASLAGGTSLVAHTTKAATRLASNTSPEPFSNIGLSLGEDAAVLGGLALVHFNPLLALSIFVLGIAAFLYFAPKILRAMKAKIWLSWKKLNGPADLSMPVKLPRTLPSRFASVFSRQNVLGETIAWATPCISGRGRRIPANLFGALVATNEEPRKLFFVARKSGRPFARTIELDGSMAAHEPKFLSENLNIFPKVGKGAKYSFIFPRSHAALVEKIVQDLRVRINSPIWPLDLEPIGAAEVASEESDVERTVSR